MTDQEIVDRIRNGWIRVDLQTLQVQVYHKGKRKFLIKKPDQHPESGRWRFRLGPTRRTVYRNRLVWMAAHREVPPGFVDHKNEDPLDDRPENLQIHTPAESCVQGREIQRRKIVQGVFDYFDYIAFCGCEPPPGSPIDLA